MNGDAVVVIRREHAALRSLEARRVRHPEGERAGWESHLARHVGRHPVTRLIDEDFHLNRILVDEHNAAGAVGRIARRPSRWAEPAAQFLQIAAKLGHLALEATDVFQSLLTS